MNWDVKDNVIQLFRSKGQAVTRKVKDVTTGGVKDVVIPPLIAVALLVGSVALAHGVNWVMSDHTPDETCAKCVASCTPLAVTACRPSRYPFADSPVRVECACAVGGGTP
jgi:hypothetical protein